MEVLEKGIESLRRITGEVPKGYRSPARSEGVCVTKLDGDSQDRTLGA